MCYWIDDSNTILSNVFGGSKDQKQGLNQMATLRGDDIEITHSISGGNSAFPPFFGELLLSQDRMTWNQGGPTRSSDAVETFAVVQRYVLVFSDQSEYPSTAQKPARDQLSLGPLTLDSLSSNLIVG